MVQKKKLKSGAFISQQIRLTQVSYTCLDFPYSSKRIYFHLTTTLLVLSIPLSTINYPLVLLSRFFRKDIGFLNTEMASSASWRDYYPHTSTQEEKTKFLLDLGHTIPINTKKSTGKMVFPFLHLPLELQVEILNHLSLYSDLKKLCLLSKRFSIIATPRLYYRVDLRLRCDSKISTMRLSYEEPQRLQKIRSLLLQPANLRLVRVFKTGQFGQESSLLIDQLLPLFQNDFLLKFSYFTTLTSCFPTPLQLQFLLGRQKHLHNLKLYSHLVPWLKHELGQSALAKSFTKLDIGSSSEWEMTRSTILFWPLKNLDLSLLQSLSLNGTNISPELIPALIQLFTGPFFVSLNKLSLITIGLPPKILGFRSALTLDNIRSLKSLVIHDCDIVLGPIPVLAFPYNFQLQSLTIWTTSDVEGLTHLLTQVRGLRYLMIGTSKQVCKVDQAILDLTDAIVLHKDTLQLLKLKLDLCRLRCGPSAQQWDAALVKKIQLCKKIVNLSIPLVWKQQAHYYRNLFAVFPNLSSLVISTGHARLAKVQLTISRASI